MSRGRSLCALVVMGMALVACSAPSASAPASAPAGAPAASSPAAGASSVPKTGQTVRLGASNAGAPNAPIYIADALGYFTDQGLSVDETFLQSASEVVPALARGDLDAAIVGVNPATLNALGSNFGIKFVADQGSQPPGYALNVLVISKQLEGSVHGPADLRGKKIGLTSPGLGTASGFMISKYLAQAGMTPADVDIQPLNFPDQVAALTNHSIDAAMMTEPFATRTVQTGVGVVLAPGDQIVLNQQVSTIVYTDRFATGQHDVAIKWMTAYLHGVRSYLAAFSTGENRDQVIKILTDRTDIKDAQLWTQMYPPGVDPNGQLNVQSMIDSQAYFQSLGLVQKPIDVPSMIDTSFAQAAVQALGPAPAATPVAPRRS